VESVVNGGGPTSPYLPELGAGCLVEAEPRALHTLAQPSASLFAKCQHPIGKFGADIGSQRLTTRSPSSAAPGGTSDPCCAGPRASSGLLVNALSLYDSSRHSLRVRVVLCTGKP
jgi:hypothetical protein